MQIKDQRCVRQLQKGLTGVNGELTKVLQRIVKEVWEVEVVV